MRSSFSGNLFSKKWEGQSRVINQEDMYLNNTCIPLFLLPFHLELNNCVCSAVREMFNSNILNSYRQINIYEGKIFNKIMGRGPLSSL